MPLTNPLRPALLPGLLAALTLACGGGGKPPAPPAGDVLDQLGVKKTAVARSDGAVAHPLGKPFATYRKRSELYFSGFHVWDANLPGLSGKHQGLLDDKLNVTGGAARGYASLFTAVDDEWTRYPAASVAADVDGDGHEEVVVLYAADNGQAFLRLIRRTGPGTYEQGQELPLGALPRTRYAAYGYEKLQLAAGDLDRDGADELVMVVGNQLYVEDLVQGAFQRITDNAYRSGAEAQITSVAVGNVDDDPALEIVVADGIDQQINSGSYYVYELRGGQLFLEAGGPDSPIMERSNLVDRRGFVTARVAIGDLDDDKLNEVIFAGDTLTNAISVAVYKFDQASRTYRVVTSERFGYGGGNWADQYLPVAAVFDADGRQTPRKELLMYRSILALSEDGTLVHRFPGLYLGDPWLDKVVVGDVTGDGQEEVIFASSDDATSVQVWGYESGSFKKLDALDLDARAFVDAGVSVGAVNLCAVNIDDDSTVLRFTGQYELLYSQPQLVAVLASPPFYAGQDASAGSTAFGWSAGGSQGTGSALGVTAGLSVGFSFETPFWGSAGSSEVKLNIDSSLDWTSATTASWTGEASKVCPAGEPCVIFTATPVDVFYYEVVASPVAGQAGQLMTIQVPRTPRIEDAPLATFNAVVDEPYRVPAALQAELAGALGVPSRYPSRAQMLSQFSGDPPLAGGFRTPDGLMLGLRPGATASNALGLETGVETSAGTEFNLNVGLEAQTVTGGVLVGGRVGFHYGYSQSESVTTGTVIEGVVPPIPAGRPASDAYKVGLFAYRDARADGSQFVVVNYWYEP
jgi:hypothetical protein